MTGGSRHFPTCPEEPGTLRTPCRLCAWATGSLCAHPGPGSLFPAAEGTGPSSRLVSGNPAGNKQAQVEKGKKIHQLLNAFLVSKYFAWCELRLGRDARRNGPRELLSTQIRRDDSALSDPARWTGQPSSENIWRLNPRSRGGAGPTWRCRAPPGLPTPRHSLGPHFLRLALQPEALPAPDFPPFLPGWVLLPCLCLDRVASPPQASLLLKAACAPTETRTRARVSACCSHFTDTDTEAQREEGVSPRSWGVCKQVSGL